MLMAWIFYFVDIHMPLKRLYSVNMGLWRSASHSQQLALSRPRLEDVRNGNGRIPIGEMRIVPSPTHGYAKPKTGQLVTHTSKKLSPRGG